MNRHRDPEFPQPLHGQPGASPPHLAACVAGDGDGDDCAGSREFEAMDSDA